ncbi:OmpA/MotB protein [Salinisphaera dokdonensis CL-ES53]|uniref:OmpA/MotB protein n=1 Tax=Salinisphaera dokdonensis CL-ES53 TaxID=1304272 RepID=A0ABV2B4K8_9GAMM
MKELQNGCRLAIAGVAALALFGCASSPDTAESEPGYYVTNPDGEVYKDAAGNCWHAPNVEKNEMREECGDQVAQTDGDDDGDGVPNSRDRCPGTPMGTQVDARGCPIEKQAPIVLKGVTFEFDSARLTAQAESRLDNVAEALQSSESMQVRVSGHTDSTGSDAYNETLSQNRADSVKRYLVNEGIDGSRMTTRGYGESRPVATNETAAGRAQNRRVELDVMGQ